MSCGGPETHNYGRPMPDFGAFVPGEHHIELVTGEYLDLAAPDPDRITIDAVAHGLSNTCRFAGQARRFYSVAEHAVLVQSKLRAEGATTAAQLAGLHHDDAEAFIGDVTRPLKALLPGYRNLELQIDYAIRQALGLPDPDADTTHLVKLADDWALSCESHHLLPSKGRTWFCAGLYDPEARDPIGWTDMLGLSPERARDLYIQRHIRLKAALLHERRAA